MKQFSSPMKESDAFETSCEMKESDVSCLYELIKILSSKKKKIEMII